MVLGGHGGMGQGWRPCPISASGEFWQGIIQNEILLFFITILVL